MPYNYVGGNIMGVKWNVMCTQSGNKGKERDWGVSESVVTLSGFIGLSHRASYLPSSCDVYC